MAVSLAVTAGGILLAYMLLNVRPPTDPNAPYITLNAILLQNLGRGRFGIAFMGVTLVSEAALLLVAAQTGFIDGPRVMANMALDSWIPHRFSSLSERLTLQDGVLMMGAAGAATLLFTRGDIGALVTMYAINVFITFSLTQLGMCRYWWSERRRNRRWIRALPIHGVWALMCMGILITMICEKFFDIEKPGRRLGDAGGDRRAGGVVPAHPALLPARQGDERRVLAARRGPAAGPGRPAGRRRPRPGDGNGDPAGRGLQRPRRPLAHDHSADVPGVFRQVVFVSVGVMDSGNFKGVEEVERLRAQTQESLDRYVAIARRLGLKSTSMMLVGTDPTSECEELCLQVARRFPKVTFFAGQLVFQREKWYHRLLHNNTAFALQRRLHWEGLPVLILPARVFN